MRDNMYEHFIIIMSKDIFCRIILAIYSALYNVEITNLYITIHTISQQYSQFYLQLSFYFVTQQYCTHKLSANCSLKVNILAVVPMMVNTSTSTLLSFWAYCLGVACFVTKPAWHSCLING